MRLNQIKGFCKLRINLAFAFALLLLSGCNEDPTSLGYSLVQDTVDIYAVNSDEYNLFSKEETYTFPLNFINPGISLIGKWGDTKSGVLVRFGLIPDSLAYLTESDIISAEITMHPHRYAVGDTANSNLLAFGIHAVNNKWIVETGNDEFFAGSLYFASPFASYSASPARKDTMDAITLPFSKSLLVDWFAKQASKVDTVWGIALVPNENSTIINQFYGSGADVSLAPFLKIIFNNKNNKRDTLVLQSAMEKNFSKGNDESSDRLIVQGAISKRTRFTFNIDTIPDFAGIHKAEMKLTIDRSKSFSGNFPLDTIIRLDYYQTQDDEYNKKAALLYYAGRREPASDVFIVPSITSAISYWNRTGKEGTFVVGFDNIRSQYRLNKLAFYSSLDPDKTKRPKLTIIYSVLKKKGEK